MTWYTGAAFYDTLLAVGLAFAGVVSVISVFLPSPYGRFSSRRFGLRLGPRLGWFLMELPAPVSFVLVFFAGPQRGELVPLLFLVIWLVHYANRAVVFPFLIRSPAGAKASFSFLVVVVGWGVTVVHGYLNAAYISSYSTHYTEAWLSDPRLIAGLVIYCGCLGLNIHADGILRNLRSKAEVARGEKIYRIPHGGLFRWITCPSYLTELLAWAGYALMTWSLAGVFVFAISCANLVPRAFATHRWYKERFADYPAERKALVPFLL